MEKTNSFNIKLCSLLLLCILGTQNKSAAQWTSASNSDNSIASTSVLNIHSAAVIDYSNVATCGSCTGPTQLYAVSYTDRSTTPAVPKILLSDDGFLGGSTVTISGLGLGPSSLVLGNVNNSSSSHLYLAITYASGTSIYLDVYDVSGVGTGSLSVGGSPVSSTVIFTGTHGHGGGLPVMDIIPEYGNLWYSNAVSSSAALPFCNKIMLAYQPEAGNNEVVQYCDLNGLVTWSSYTIPVSLAGGPQVWDIAGVQINNSGVDDYALIPASYGVSAPYHTAVFQWQEGTSTYTTVGSVTGSTGFDNPFIDAIKDYNLWGTTNYANWMVALNTSPTPMQVYEYSNLSSTSLTDITSIGSFNLSSPGDTDRIPDIAIGPGDYYTIGYGTNYTPASGGQIASQEVMISGASVGSTYYQVPKTVYTGYGDKEPIFRTTCNTNAGTAVKPPYLYVFWNHLTGYTTSDIYEKSSADPLSFKHAPTGVTRISLNKDWMVGPNPITDHFNIMAPKDYQPTGNETYTLTDITGRQMATSAITNPSQQVNISEYAAGVYLLHIYSNNSELKTVKVVKE